MAPRLRPLLTPPNDGTQKENRLDLRVALKKGAGHVDGDVSPGRPGRPGRTGRTGPTERTDGVCFSTARVVPFAKGKPAADGHRTQKARPNGRRNGMGTSGGPRDHYRDAAAQLCLKTVAMALCVPFDQLVAANRCKADIALARQIAMYLVHTQFSIAMSEVGLAFRRDRTTVSHACRLVEDKRDDDVFDLMIGQLEGLLGEAVNAIEARSRFVEGDSDVDQD